MSATARQRTPTMCKIPLWMAGLVLSAIILSGCQSADKGELRVAMASSLNVIADQLKNHYAAATGIDLKISTGASGNLYAQIAAGAPFDVFLSADQQYPQQMIDAGLAFEDSLTTYCYGILVVWSRKDSGIEAHNLKWDSPYWLSARQIAIANPKFAPYGEVAFDLLKKNHLWERVSDNIVFGENVSQTAHFAASGAAQIAMIPLSLAETEPLRKSGNFWRIPESEYPAIEHAAVVLKTDNLRRQRAQLFLDWLQSSEADMIFSSAGFKAVDVMKEKGRP